jgi:hypothetical protein
MSANLDWIQTRTLAWVFYITAALYVVTFLGLYVAAPTYLGILRLIMSLYVSLYLLYRFNPWRSIQFSALDKTVTFNAGVLLFTTVFLGI